ncbi:hypothetical protein G3545_03000 [Starkeya sp. ORNL1]|uniref:hypothetical protein n=1 Tax=Starkeya sp. ORNL1 TaxID=2709380 RepID=UPI00146295D8|nr:hypothetical protein [Starkeya sp. ORNL1]QJP12720.1 hypothetical protein G3545_03000 [Starkeya sp. ORNL1]
MRLLLCLVLLAGMFATSAGATDAVGFRRLRINDPVRPLGAVIALDLGLARGFDPDSLAHFTVPVLVIAAGNSGENIPAAMESGYLAAHLPKSTTRFVTASRAAHFSFLPLCKPGAVALLETDKPGDGMVCRDGEEGRRAGVHQETIAEVIRFLAAPPN